MHASVVCVCVCVYIYIYIYIYSFDEFGHSLLVHFDKTHKNHHYTRAKVFTHVHFFYGMRTHSNFAKNMTTL